MKRILASSLATLLAASAAFAAEAKPAPAAPPTDLKPFVEGINLKDGDTVVFLGDSITHQCLYTQYIEDYFYTRYPKLHIHFHNAGVGGDRAKDALTRMRVTSSARAPMVGLNTHSVTMDQLRTIRPD